MLLRKHFESDLEDTSGTYHDLPTLHSAVLMGNNGDGWDRIIVLVTLIILWWILSIFASQYQIEVCYYERRGYQGAQPNLHGWKQWKDATMMKLRRENGHWYQICANRPTNPQSSEGRYFISSYTICERFDKDGDYTCPKTYSISCSNKATV